MAISRLIDPTRDKARTCAVALDHSSSGFGDPRSIRYARGV